MCGIFGFVIHRGSSIGQKEALFSLQRLVSLSERRGKEASGLAVRQDDRIWMHKAPLTASKLLKRPEIRHFLDEAFPERFPADAASARALIGHARLTTNGYQGIRHNNQPVAVKGVIGVHNGIIVNVDDLWRQHPEMTRNTDVDTEIFMSLLGRRLELGQPLEPALASVYEEIQGSASVALLFTDHEKLVLASNTGSLYICVSADSRSFFFASEGPFLRRLMSSKGLHAVVGDHEIRQVKSGMALSVDLNDLGISRFSLAAPTGSGPLILSHSRSVAVFDTIVAEEEGRRAIRRCTRCVLPETMPYIDFDEQGVCNYCRTYKPIRTKGKEALEKVVRSFRPGPNADCIVAFSCGRQHPFRQAIGVLSRFLGLPSRIEKIKTDPANHTLRIGV